MLTKSQARAFFVAGTGLSFIAFIGLTVDTISKVPAQTRGEAITPQVERGKDLWDQSNCMGCHTLFGEGGYYAPELTKVMERRGPLFVHAMLKDPASMYPKERRMQNYGFSEEQITDLIAFLTWCGQVDLNGFPPKPTMMQVALPASAPGTPPGAAVAAASNRPQVFNQLCVACHTLEGQGGQVGPVLDDVGSRLNAEQLRRWLTDPQAYKPGALMPKLPLTEEQIGELAAFLSQKKKVTP